MAYDATWRRVIMHGGSLKADVWSWDGTAWRQMFPNPIPTARQDHIMAYDVARRGVVMFGGNFGFGDDTWVGRNDADAPNEVCRSGFDADNDGLLACADPDCRGYCDPFCQAYNICTGTRPRCGDGSCNSGLENYRLCPGDCTTAPNICGDWICDSTAGEAITLGNCPGDCTP
jgi:hypothetical protein